MTNLAKKIFLESLTAQEARARLEEWREMATEHFFGGKQLSSQDAADLLGVDKDNLEEVLARAKEDLDKIETLIVYTGVELSKDMAARLAKKAREAVGADIFVEFKLDPGLLAGAALAWRGEYKDYSLKAKFAEKKNGVREIYNQFLGTI